MWSGWVFQPILDLNGDGAVDEADVPIEYDLLVNDGNENTIIDPEEFQNWLDDNQYGWVFPSSLDLNEDGDVNELDAEYACWSSYDDNGNGIIEDSELIAHGIVDTDFDGEYRDDLALVDPCGYDLNGDGYISPFDGTYDELDEFEYWLEDQIPGDQSEADFYVDLWEYYETPVWVFTVADLVYQNQVVTNQGIKNLQIRFYPVATTGFTPAPVE